MNADEKQIPIREAARLIGWSGESLIRWHTIGARSASGSRVYLEAERWPGGYRTSVEAVARFRAALQAPKAERAPDASEDPATLGASQKAIDRAEESLRKKFRRRPVPA